MTVEFDQKFLSRFWAKVKKTDDAETCWLWTASTSHGYGQIGFKKSRLAAHRVAYMLAHGDPGDLDVLHTCDTPRCCNPCHLFLGTQADNVHDMIAKGRDRKAFGETHGYAKLTTAKVIEIRRRFSAGEANQTQLSQQFNVSQKQIHAIVRRKQWRWLTDEITHG